MHILFFEDKPTRFAGGQERSLFETAQRFHNQGIKVSLAFKEEGDLLKEYQGICETTFLLRSRQLRIKEIVYHIEDLLVLHTQNQAHLFTHLYSNQYFDIPFVGLASILFNKKSICHLRIPAPPYFSKQYRFFLEKTDRIITISKHTLQTYRDVGLKNSSMEVVYNQIPKPNFIPPKKLPNGIQTISYAGRICPEKGAELLLRAFALALQTNPNMELRYYGNVRGENTPPNYIEELIEKAQSLDINDKVHFYPHQENFADIAKVTDVFVLPSYWEAFGRVIVEASHFGIPCIATNVGGIPEVMEIVGYQEYLCEPTIESLAKSLVCVSILS